MTNVKIIAKTATVTINGSHVVAIGEIASLVALIVVPAAAVTPELDPNLSRTKIPTPKIIPTNTSKRTNWYNCPISILYIPPFHDYLIYLTLY
jgi:hypothetical protein